ncbi:MAG: hypothetical protein AUI36_02985, partial [Cyanobacteria bacterium 13_1_40CM_2_61_4]
PCVGARTKRIARSFPPRSRPDVVLNGSKGPDSAREDPTVIFLHIGKTAGTTLRRILRRNFRSAEIMVVRARGRPRTETLDDFGALPQAERARPRLIMGHTVFGLHERVPRPSTYISMVRRPKSLVLSQYNFVLRTPGHRHHEEVTRRGLALEDYIESGLSLEMDNSQTRAIAGDLDTPFGACTDEMLALAKRNIEGHFAVVGITERFDESLILLQRAFGWRRVSYVSANVARGERPEPSPGALQLIARHNRLDDELYRWVGERFDAAIAADPLFEATYER